MDKIKAKMIATFLADIKHLKGAPATPSNKAEGRAIIEHYSSHLQMADLNLSLQAARDVLATAYKTI